jgi:nucleotide-binding universal stress UspA family protein
MYRKILVPVDGSTTSFKGLGEAIELVKATGGKLKLVHVVNELFIMDAGYAPALYYEQMVLALREAGKEVLEQAVVVAKTQDVQVESELAEAIGGRAADSIIDVARQWGAELIVMGTHGRRGLRRLVLGSDAELVLRQSPVPVLMVRDAPESR